MLAQERRDSVANTFEIIGVYKVVPTVESIVQAVKFHKYKWLLDDNGEFTDEIYWGNFENLCLLEMKVQGDYLPELLTNISQRSSEDVEQAPYLEYYLDSSGTKLLSEEETRSTDDRRVCFFLHFTDTNLPIYIHEISIELPQISDLPKRLEPFTHFIPAD